METTNGTAQEATNGNAPQDQTPDVSLFLQAIQAIYNPQSTNDVRRAANELLENAKSSNEARELGFSLAIDTSQDPTLRHYGLTLLEYHTRYVLQEHDDDLESLLRQCVLKLAQNVRQEDPSFLRNKVAHLWTILAKKSWGTHWIDMDEQLVELFNASQPHREMVLYVLQTLSEDVFHKERDDSLVAVRPEVLANALINIFTPKEFTKQEKDMGLRAGTEGWLQRLDAYLDWSLENDTSVTAKALEAHGAMLAVMPSGTLAAVGGMGPVCRCVIVGDSAIRLAAVEALTGVVSREKMVDEDALKVIMPLFATDSVQSLQSVYQWARVSPNDIDDAKYTLLQKIAKLISRLGFWIVKNPALIPDSSDLPRFFELMFEVARDLSLKVSEPVLRLWTHLLRVPALRDSSIIQQSIGPLMEMCSQRLVRYEALPEDSDDPIVVFINEDFDTIPEKHMFLGNYRRYCVEVVEAAVRKYPVDAVSHILGQAQTLFKDLQTSLQNFSPRDFSKKSPQFLRVDAQVVLCDASVKGYNKWLVSQEEHDPQQNEQDRNKMLDDFTSYFETVLAMQFPDPAIQRRLLSSLTHMACRVFVKTRPDLSNKLLDRLFCLRLTEDPSQPEYSEAAKSLTFLGVSESQKLAIIHADALLPMFDELQQRVQEKVATEDLDVAHQLGWRNFLFLLVLHSQSLDAETKFAKLKDMTAASTAAWVSPEFAEATKDFGSFYSWLGLSQLPDYVYSHNFHRIDVWSDSMLDQDGINLQENVTARVEHIPHRGTRMLLMATFDKMKDDDPTFEIVKRLWADSMPTILPNLMQTLKYAHTFGDDASWPGVPEEMLKVIRKMLTDRFWQAGISNESMDDFYARVNSSRQSYEGFASSIRGAIRQVREKSYSILCYFTRLEGHFYGLPELPDVLASNVYGTARSLSAHQWTIILNMSDQIIRGCPTELRSQFLPAVLISLFQNLENKLNAEWELVNKRTVEAGENDNLGDEMKSESILRMLTYHSVLLVNGLLDIDPSASQNDPNQETRMYRTILSDLNLLGAVLIFLTSALRMRDTRSNSIVIVAFNRVIPFFRKDTPIREFFSENVLKAAIQCFNEPYFVDSQSKLAGLIAQIISLEESGPKQLILGLPGMKPDKVEERFARLRATRSPAEGGREVLKMLQGLRGVSIHELGKMERPKRPRAKETAGMEGMLEQGIRRGGEDELDGLADIFGGAP